MAGCSDHIGMMDSMFMCMCRRKRVPSRAVAAGALLGWLTHAGNSLLCRRPKVWRGRFLNIRMPAAACSMGWDLRGWMSC